MDRKLDPQGWPQPGRWRRRPARQYHPAGAIEPAAFECGQHLYRPRCFRRGIIVDEKNEIAGRFSYRAITREAGTLTRLENPAHREWRTTC